jgi:mono/diheme cytochrome c family protein
VLSTAGGLVFQGDSTGELSAFSALDGKRLWSFQSQAGVVAAPMSYEIGGEQYVALMVGWAGAFAMIDAPRPTAIGPNRILVFTLGANKTLPEKKPAAQKFMVAGGLPAGSAEQITRGGNLYNTYCYRCHGYGAVSGGLTPDLRASGSLATEAWFDVLLKGARAEAGMASFAEVLDRSQAAAIRSYVISLAREKQ